MSLSLYAVTIPVYTQMLGALSGVLDKAAAHCTAKKIDPAVLAATRLIPDMFPLSRQVQTACDFAKNPAARLVGVAAPIFEDAEKTLGDLQVRIDRTLDFVRSLDPKAIDAASGREITFPVGPTRQAKMVAEAYIQHYALPNFYFHTTMAYAIIREAGVDIGKRDYMGQVPGFSATSVT